MMRIWISAGLLCFLCLNTLMAEPAEIPPVPVEIPAPEQGEWTFSGTVNNENGEPFYYFFQIQKNHNHFHGTAAIIDGRKKNLVIFEDSSSLIENPDPDHWQVGSLFLRFNPINNSWVFGSRAKNKQGFNFKVDMLGSSSLQKQQILRPGLAFMITQTGGLNGHLNPDDGQTEQFVVAKRSWFRQLEVSKPQSEKHHLKMVLCEFYDGSALYSVNMPDSDALRAAMAGWRNEQGAAVPISQFVSFSKEKENNWGIQISSPKLNLSLQNFLENLDETHALIFGPVTGVKPGYCAIDQTEIGGEVVTV